VRRILPGLVAAATLLLMPFGGAADAVRPPHADKAGDPNYHRPVVGECRDLTIADIYPHSNTTPTLDCTEAHTSKVIAVAQLPAGRTWANTPVEAQSRIIYRACYPALFSILGRSYAVRDMTAFSSAWFIPTKAERNKGARWLRCDLVLYAGTKLADIPYDAAPMLPAPPLPDSVARCLTGKFYNTVCAARHSFRASGTFQIGSRKYPSERKFNNAGQQRCPAIVTTKAFRWTWPSESRWAAGDHVVVCYSKTTR
jgi:hypothetical protein